MREQNALLAAGGLSLRLELRGQRLGLRGPLPCRRGSGRHPVQRISLGLPADESGLRQAQQQLRKLVQQLQQQRFHWADWGSARPAAPAASGGISPTTLPEPPPLHSRARLDHGAPWLAAFERSFHGEARRRHNRAGTLTTWRSAYLPYLRRLEAQALAGGGPPDGDLLLQVLESYGPASRSRQQCGLVLAALARFLELELPPDWGQRAGGYGLHRAQFRQLPSDAVILELLERIPNPQWRLAYGLMATYGLRNHEVFFCDLSSLAPGGDRVLRVLPTSKTGEHQVWPFQPAWVEHFDLPRLGAEVAALPPVCTDLGRTTLQQVGRRVAEQFRRYGLPITPYDLRHAWAVRTIHIGLPDTVAARMMGHSVTIHTRTYHHWITRRDQQQAVDAALSRQRQSAATA
ncbi:site-specific integrase [Cyanobium sp. Morenito 9A2]|nr:site-specific integrase [Cyanobium sp. Morenito 9A2]